MRFTIINLIDNTVKHYDIFPEASKKEGNNLRKKRKIPKKQTPKARKGHQKKETGKATFNQKANLKGRSVIFNLHKKSGYAEVRPMRSGKQLDLRTLNKAWKKISKMG